MKCGPQKEIFFLAELWTVTGTGICVQEAVLER